MSGFHNRNIKTDWKPGTMVYPLPAAIISCGTTPEEYNLITLSWIGTICSDPPMLSISIRPERHSYDIIKKNMEFVVNLTHKQLLRAADFCGVKSGKNLNKWAELKLTPYPSSKIKTPQIDKSPVSIECVVKKIIPLGSHDMFLAEVVNVSVLNDLIDKKGALRLEEADLVSYIHGGYYTSPQKQGFFGFSVARKKKFKKKK